MEFEHFSSKRSGQFRPSFPVTRVNRIVFPAGVMKDGEQLYDLDVCAGSLGKEKPILENTPPMPDTMQPIPREKVLEADGLNDRFQSIQLLCPSPNKVPKEDP